VSWLSDNFYLDSKEPNFAIKNFQPMKALIVVMTALHLCKSLVPTEMEDAVQAPDERVQLARDLHNLLRSFYRNRAESDKERIKKARKKALKQKEKEKEEEMLVLVPSPWEYFAEFFTAYYNRIIYVFICLENPHYERNLEYFILKISHTFLDTSPKSFLEEYAGFFDDFSYRFFKCHIKNYRSRRLLGDDIESLKLKKEMPKILAENPNLDWDNYHSVIDKRLDELMEQFELKYEIQDIR
jgi:hypothetical protein